MPALTRPEHLYFAVFKKHLFSSSFAPRHHISLLKKLCYTLIFMSLMEDKGAKLETLSF